MLVTWGFLTVFVTTGVAGKSPDKFNLIVPGSVSAHMGSTVTLPCAVSPTFSVVPLKMRWHRPNRFKTPVLLYENRNVQQDPAGTGYRGRVSLVGNLEQGNVSMKLENITPADNGTYLCYVQSSIWYEEAGVPLNVEGEVIGSVPLLNVPKRDDGQVNVTCTSHGWFPQPTLTWTVGGGEEINAVNNTVYTTDDQSLWSMRSWLLHPFSEERICCSVGLSDQKRKEGCVVIFAHIEYKLQ
ncbi:butyrophilin-like protein 2 [Sardina pilchardus]|uniref:butyrophilin-like protein 2 n=1 Tax=Sardina pilchardus TaxID=27697 RepID=UPI002E135D5E